MLKRFLLAGVVLSLATGCSSGLKSKRLTEEKLTKGARIAVLPFENLSGKEGASEKITEFFVMTLQSEKIVEICEFGQVYEQMRRFRIRSGSLLTNDQIDSLASSIDVNYIVAGSVLDFRQTDNQFLGQVPQVSFNVKLIDCGTHQTVWVGVANARGDQNELIFGMGAIRSLDDLAHTTVERAVHELASTFRR